MLRPIYETDKGRLKIMPITSKEAQDSQKKKQERAAYLAELKARPASTWENMPPMISIPSGRTARSGKTKP